MARKKLTRTERKAKWRAYYEEHTERVLTQQKEYRQTVRGKAVRRKASKRRQRKLKRRERSFTEDDWKLLLRVFSYRCYYCHRPQSECGPLQKDHSVPVARGGATTVENIKPVCEDCNRRKGAMTERMFKKLLRRERRR